MKTIDDLIEAPGWSGDAEAIDHDKLRKLLADSIRNCREDIKLEDEQFIFPDYESKCGVKPIGIDKPILCQACQRILELMPSVKEILK